MVSLEIENVKEFMAQLFHADSCFNEFDVLDVKVQTLYQTKISGRTNPRWSETDEETNEYVSWQLIKPVIVQLIKGKKTPQVMIINYTKPLESGDRGALQIHFEEDKLHVITGYSMAGFSLDKTKEQDWDRECMSFIENHGITFLKNS